MDSAHVRILFFSLLALVLLTSDNPPTRRHFLVRTAVLIAYRLWTRQGTARDSRKAFGLTREAAIMAESGAIYSITLILIIATYASKSNSFNVFLDIVSYTFVTVNIIADSRII